MTDRPGWMPSDEEIAGILEVWGHEAARAIARLIERTALKAQIEVMSEWADHGDFHTGPPRRADEPCRACSKMKYLHARLAELEKP